MSDRKDGRPFGIALFRCDLTLLDGEAIVSVGGEIDLAAVPWLLRELVRPLYPPVSTLVVDMADVTFIDSSGVHALVSARSAAVAVGTTFVLSSVPQVVRQVLRVCGLAEMFDINAN